MGVSARCFGRLRKLFAYALLLISAYGFVYLAKSDVPIMRLVACWLAVYVGGRIIGEEDADARWRREAEDTDDE